MHVTRTPLILVSSINIGFSPARVFVFVVVVVIFMAVVSRWLKTESSLTMTRELAWDKATWEAQGGAVSTIWSKTTLKHDV